MDFVLEKRTVAVIMGGRPIYKRETFDLTFGSFEEAKRYVEKEYVTKLYEPKMISNYPWEAVWRSAVEYGDLEKKAETELTLKEKEE